MRARLGSRLLGTVSVVALAAPAGIGMVGPTASADHALLHSCGVVGAPARFPAGFTPPTDSEPGCGYPLGGFGGELDDDAEWQVPAPTTATVRRHPVIFVHGNVVDHADWYPARDQMIRAGWHPGDLWALSYNGLGNDSGSAGGTPNPRRDAEHRAAGGDGMARNTSNEINAPDLNAFIDEVLRFTADTNPSGRFSIVSHSLGVTLARRALELRPQQSTLDDVGTLVAFVGIAGGNDGTSLCPPGSGVHVDDEGGHALNGCDELEQGSAWLSALNADDDEFGTAAVMSVYDGSGAGDVAYVGPTYADSPRLGPVRPGAVDCTYPGRGHNDLRLSPKIVEAYDAFIQAAHGGAPLAACPEDYLGLRPLLP